MAASSSLAQLIFNASAVRNLKQHGNQIRLRIDQGHLFLQATPRRPSADIVPLVRRANGTQIDLARDAELSEQVLQTLDALGCTPEQPYFLLNARPRRWFELQHTEGGTAPREGHLRVVRPPSTLSQITQARQAIEQASLHLAALKPSELKQVLPPAVDLAQAIARWQQRLYVKGLPPELRQLLDDKTLVAADGDESNRRVSAWMQADKDIQPRKVTVDDVKRVINNEPRPQPRHKPLPYLSDEEANRIIAQFTGD